MCSNRALRLRVELLRKTKSRRPAFATCCASPPPRCRRTRSTRGPASSSLCTPSFCCSPRGPSRWALEASRRRPSGFRGWPARMPRRQAASWRASGPPSARDQDRAVPAACALPIRVADGADAGSGRRGHVATFSSDFVVMSNIARRFIGRVRCASGSPGISPSCRFQGEEGSGSPIAAPISTSPWGRQAE